MTNAHSTLAIPPAAPPPRLGSWRYACPRASRKTLGLAALISASLHAGVIFGLGRTPPRPPPQPQEENLIALTLVIPEVQELEELDPLPSDEPAPATDFGLAIPMQADLPSLPQPSDFVQALDFASLVEQPDLTQTKIVAIPANLRRKKIGEGLGDIFNLLDLDRIPEPTFQPPPIFPEALKREIPAATVSVEFIVDTNGRVVNAYAAESSHHGFELAAVTGVGRWKFRPGMRGGRKVNTRMRVLIRFKIAGDDA